MKTKTIFTMAVSLLLGFVTSFSALAEQEFPDITEEGLHKLKDTKLAVVYAKPGVNLGVYNRVWLLDATVAFKKNWQRSQNRSYSHKINAKDMERIQLGVAELFNEVFTEKLTAGGYELVTESAEDVLLVRPAIVNLNVLAPDVSSTSRSYQMTRSAGEMSLFVELYDSVTLDLLGKALDRMMDRESMSLQWQTGGANRVAAKKILNTWADTLVAALDNAHSATAVKTENE
jgi:hypothetical protein